jgi:GH15 family glucan-1,4-alpha-glucosidase
MRLPCLHAGERVVFVLSLGETAPDAEATLVASEAFWRDWHARGRYPALWHDMAARSALVLKALTFAPTGAMVAAPTTSLPELPGGTRNWDYRFCWLRDSALAVRALLRTGHLEEAVAWRDWLVRSLAGDPAQIQPLYGLGGERELPERETARLPGYQQSRPVRIGNAAAGQVQLDVYGELMHTLYRCAQDGLAITPAVWDLQRALLAHLEAIWTEPDEGIWEVRGGRRHFTFSKVMAWVAFDRAVRTAEEFGLAGPLAHWRAMRELIHATVCRDGLDPGRGCFVRSFGATALDASLLQIPLVGFLPPDDPRVLATVAAIERDLTEDGFVLRYRAADGLPPGEGVFLACSFWLAEIMVQQGRAAEAAALFARLLGLANDVGLLAEEYDPRARRLRGNFPQAFSHLALIDTAIGLATGSAYALFRRPRAHSKLLPIGRATPPWRRPGASSGASMSACVQPPPIALYRLSRAWKRDTRACTSMSCALYNVVCAVSTVVTSTVPAANWARAMSAERRAVVTAWACNPSCSVV